MKQCSFGHWKYFAPFDIADYSWQYIWANVLKLFITDFSTCKSISVAKIPTNISNTISVHCSGHQRSKYMEDKLHKSISSVYYMVLSKNKEKNKMKLIGTTNSPCEEKMGVPTAFGRCGPGPILGYNDKRDAGLHANRQQRYQPGSVEMD